MDDLKREVMEVWKLRLKMERLKKKIRAFEWLVESDEFKEEHGEAAYKHARQVLDETKEEFAEVEVDQKKLEEKIQLPNPYLRKPD